MDPLILRFFSTANTTVLYNPLLVDSVDSEGYGGAVDRGL